MVSSPKSKSRVPLRFEGDARAVVPVNDEIGGTVIYVAGRPAYYVLHGEWFRAVPETGGTMASGDALPLLADGGSASPELVSTS